MSSFLNFTFPIGNQYEGSQYQALWSLNCLELAAHIFLDCPFSAINFWLIFKTSVLHSNLKFILLCQSACIFIRAIARTILNIYRLTSDNNLASGGPYLLGFFYIQPTYIRNFIFHILVVERIMATVYFKNYEKSRSKSFSVSWFFLTFLVAMVNTNAYYLFGREASMNIGFATFFATFILGIFELVAFAWIWQRNDRIYHKHIFSLSEKYQLSENIRTARQLIPCIILHFINVVFGTTQSVLGYYKLMGTDQFYYDMIGGQFVFTTSTIISFLIELSMIIYHPFLKRELVRKWNSFKRCDYLPSANNSVAPQNTGVELKKLVNIYGDPLMATSMEHIREEHFRQLTSAWEARPNSR